jgi:two-component system response regulator (stage 0 sporulation protein F)
MINHNVGEILSEQLACEGHRFSSVRDVDSLWNHLRDLRPDLVLLDLYLEGFKGWEILHTIKKQKPDLPVLILSAYDTFSEDPRLSQVDGYVVKSFSDFGKLKQTIDDILKRKKAP